MQLPDTFSLFDQPTLFGAWVKVYKHTINSYLQLFQPVLWGGSSFTIISAAGIVTFLMRCAVTGLASEFYGKGVKKRFFKEQVLFMDWGEGGGVRKQDC